MRSTLLFILLNFTFFLYSQELHPVKKYWMPNGNVNVIERDTINDLIYLGGSFTSVGPQVGHGALLTTTANIPDFSFPIPNGRVLKSIADGNGGWYLSGEFTKIGDSLRDGLCHILANGVVDTLFRTKSVVGIIKALHLKDSTLFIGGIMEAFGETKKNGALFNTNNNVPLNYFPETDGSVRVSIPDGNGGLYIGGQFTNVGDSIRNNIAHVDNLGNVTSWNPSINGTVNILQLSSGHIFIGGDFDLINGQTRTKLGSVLAIDGTLTNWNPNISGEIASIKVYGDTVYLGGNFTSVGGYSRNNLAAVDNILGGVFGWDPSPNGHVTSMEFYNGKLVVGGNFTVISGQNRTRLAIINLNSTNLTTFSASLNNIPLCLSVLADTIFLGGKFTTVNSFGQEKLAKINAQTGALLGSLFQINGDVNTISVIDSDSIVIGGTFTIINNVSRKKIALVNYSGNSSAIYSWAPVIQVNNVNNIVYTSNISGGKIYVGGLLSKIGGKAVSNVFSLNTNQGQLLSWLPVINNVVMDIDFYANSLVIAGGFTSVNGITRHQLAFFDYPSGNLNNINYTVQGGMLNTIAISNNIIYLGGDFNSVNSVLRNKLGSINLITGNLTSWNYNPSHTVNCIIVANNMIFVGGNFGWLTANYLRYGLASFYESTGTISSWSPVLNDQPFEISAIGNELFVGGEFTEINGLKRNHIGSIYINSGQTTNWDPLATDIVRTVCTQNNKIFVGGDFLSVGGRWVNNITVLDENTGFAQPWNPDIGGVVYCIKRLNNQVFIGGDFTVVGNIPTLNLASVDAISGALNTWFPETDQMVMTLDLSSTGLIIGGFFTSVGGISRQNIAAINTSNGNILGWYPILDGFVQSIKVKGNSVYTIGGFLNVNGSPRSGFASIDAITGILNSLDAGLLGESATFDIKNNIVYLVEESIPPYTTQGVNVRLIDASSGISTSWPIDLNNYVYAVAEFGNQVFVGGQYMVVENIFSPGIAAFDPANGNLSSWNANIQPTSSSPYSRIIRDLKTSENQIYLGGNFGGLIGEKITNFAVLSDCLPNTGTNILSACDSLTWINGITYYSSNYTDTYTLTNSDGCDSIVTLNLTISYTTNTVDTHIECDTFTWINGNTYNISNNTDTFILSSSAGCDSIITLDLTILSSSMGTDLQIACDSFTWIDGITYFNSTISPIYSISNSVGCDSIINLNLTIIQNELLDINIFSSPSDSINCNGALAFSLLGNPNFIIELDNGAQQDTTTMNSVFVNICPGIHSLVITDGCSDIDTVVAIVPIDSNYIYVNSFLDSLILDSLGTTFSNCTIYYNSIDTAYIDSIWNVGNIVNVVWNIVDSTGSNYDTSTYILNNGNGTYLLQLNIFCPTENENNFFTVTQAVYFNDGIIYTNGLENDEIEKIVIYPNPTEGILNVSSNNIINSIKLFDLNGKIILKNTFYKTDVNMDLREMSPGIYFVKVETNNLSKTYKVILQ